MPDYHKKHPYRWRLILRSKLPWFLIRLGIANKGKDCELRRASHDWYNHNDTSSACYYCKVVKIGQLWKKNHQES